jgi:predicted dehydrogenase
MRAVVADGTAEVTALTDPDPTAIARAGELVPDAEVVADLDALLALPLDGVVLATPSALHAAQALQALDAGVAVFCQKPLGRTGAEVREVLGAARRADRLLGVDLSYRGTAALRAVRELVRQGDLGHVYTADLVFHNAYGPGKAWYRQPDLSGGGALVDLGIHLVDAALWVLGWPEVREVQATLWSRGERLARPPERDEDHVVAELALEGGRTVRVACSWELPAGRDAVIEATFWGTRGGACLRNLDGSFYDLVGERFDGRRTERLTTVPDPWGGRTIVAWARQLAVDPAYDVEADRHATVAAVLDAVYGRA